MEAFSHTIATLGTKAAISLRCPAVQLETGYSTAFPFIALRSLFSNQIQSVRLCLAYFKDSFCKNPFTKFQIKIHVYFGQKINHISSRPPSPSTWRPLQHLCQGVDSGFRHWV